MPMRALPSMCWTVRFDARRPLATLSVTGSGCEIIDVSGGKQALVTLPYSRHVLVSANAMTATVYSGTAVLPVYGRVKDGWVELSNRAAELMVENEIVPISTWVLVQQLLGANYPQHNLFRDIHLLEANAVYEAVPEGLRYARTTLADGDEADLREVLGMIYAGYSAAFGQSRPICVLLSGGYDSRFNLAIALRHARTSGIRVHAFHEYKDEGEFQIAKAVAERADVPLHTETRRSFAAVAEETVFDPDHVRFHSSTYRDNIPRWHGFLDAVTAQVPNGLIVGLGAEAHKGKFYGQVHNLRRDAERAVGADSGRIRDAAKSLGFREYDRDSQRRFFDELCVRSEAFGDHFSRIDFIHYHTYVVNGYGHRCYDFQQFFDVPYPLLENRFLAAVLRMPAHLKRDFRIVSAGLADLAPEMLDIPFTSGNAKALKRRPLPNMRMNELPSPLRALRQALVSSPVKGTLSSAMLERARMLTREPRSEVTERLLEFLKQLPAKTTLRSDYVLQAFLYFRMLEADKGITLKCV